MYCYYIFYFKLFLHFFLLTVSSIELLRLILQKQHFKGKVPHFFKLLVFMLYLIGCHYLKAEDFFPSSSVVVALMA